MSTAVAAAIAAAFPSGARAADTVTVSGATLFKSFFLSPGSTNDFVDVNGDGNYGFNPSPATVRVEQLAPVATYTDGGSTVTYEATALPIQRSQAWNVQYRSVGSVNGLQELLNTQAGVANPFIPLNQVSEVYINTRRVVNLGVAGQNGSGPNFSANSGSPNATPTTGVDIAVLDVPSTWGLTVPTAAPRWNTKPTQNGYGANSLASNIGTSNMLVSRTVNGVTFNNNTASPNAQTLFDTPAAVAPINAVANPGVNLVNIKATQLQHLFVTGRMSNGENLTAVTRSVGSGTHNAIMNSIGVDPSFGIGENIGGNATGAAITSLGSSYQPGNYDGSGDLENGLTNSRLGVGYDGSDRATTNGTGKWGSMRVMNDHLGGTVYVQSTVARIVDNSDVNNGWRIGGLETFVTAGDPNATGVGDYGAIGRDGINLISASNPANPAMANAAAAKYLRNITESIKAYTSSPTSTANLFMSVDQLSSSFALRAALAYVQSPTDAMTWIPNPQFNAGVRAQALNGTYNAPLVDTVGAGVVPVRKVGMYSDGSTSAYVLYDNTGASFTAAGNTALNLRNKVAGDFNGSGLRNIDQMPELMSAVRDTVAWGKAHHSGETGANPGNAAIAEIIGDFTGDGNFDARDVRYFADGLAIATSGPNTGKLDRKAGFSAVDNNGTISAAGRPAGNYFNTTLATPKLYASGDSRGDVAGATVITAGASPTGSDGVIDARDIDYVAAQIRKATGRSLVLATSGTDTSLDVNGSFTTLLTRAALNDAIDVRADLSADMNGDLAINKLDLEELVGTILGTHFGDSNLDGVVNFADFVALSNHYGMNNGGWSDGDLNGSGSVDFADFVLLSNNYGAALTLQQSAAFEAFASAAAIPEPASLALLAIGASGLLYRRRR